MANGPLHGIRVFEVTQVLAGPFCGLALADLGADVVKVEPPGGEMTRQSGQFMPGESKGFHALNRGKRSLVIDLAKPGGRELVHRLIPGFDVFMINARPGVPERLGIDYETLRGLRTDLIYLENTGFGSEGPSAHRAGSDAIAQAYSGLMAGDGKTDAHGAPVRITSTAPADLMAAVAGALGICAALLHRERTGEGQKVSTSLLQAALALQTTIIPSIPVLEAMLGSSVLDRLSEARAEGASYADQLAIRGTDHVTGAFNLYYGGYPVQDGAIVLGALTAANREQIRRALGVEDDPTRDPDFNALAPESAAVIEDVRTRLRETLLTKTMDEWMELLDREGAPATKVHFPEELLDDPQVRAMGYVLELEHELTGPERMVGPVVSLSRTPTGSSRSSAPLGRDTDEVLGEGGLTADEIAGLRASGVVA